MVDVFISYSRANQDMVRRLAEAVTRAGYSVWWDDELPPHRSYSEVITEKIGEAKAAIVVWSDGSIGSEWVRAEADLARTRKKLIQTAIDDCMPPMPFNQIQFASLAGWDGADDHPGWAKVKGSLAALCGAGADVRAVFPLPDRPPPPIAPAPALALPPRRSNLVLGVVIGGALAVIAGVGVLALSRGGEPPAANAATPALPPVSQTRPVAPATIRPAPAATPRAVVRQPVRVATPQRQPQRQQAAMPMRPRRYCMGPGRGTPQCMQMRQRRRAY